jgi:transcriptional regulator with XRE-family HTH domain
VIYTKNYRKDLPLAKYVAIYLSHELKQRGITQKEFAERIGYSDRHIRRWLKGDIKRLEIVDNIVKALNINIRDIVLFVDDIPDVF